MSDDGGKRDESVKILTDLTLQTNAAQRETEVHVVALAGKMDHLEIKQGEIMEQLDSQQKTAQRQHDEVVNTLRGITDPVELAKAKAANRGKLVAFWTGIVALAGGFAALVTKVWEALVALITTGTPPQ